MKWLRRFLFSQTFASGMTVEIRLHGQTWRTFRLAKVGGLDKLSVLGMPIVHFHLSEGAPLYIRGDWTATRDTIRVELTRMVRHGLTKTQTFVPDLYPTDSVLNNAWRHCQQELEETIQLLRSPFAEELLGDDDDLLRLRKLWRALEGDADERRTFVQNHIQQELARFKDFFDRIEKVPLTDEQRLACVVCEDRQLLVAAAGSGKSSTIVAKMGYLIARGWATPEQILALAFNKDAATELRERCLSRLSSLSDVDKIQAKTIHSFGYELIGKCRGKKPRLSPTASDDRSRLQLLRTLTQEAIASSKALAASYNILQTYLIGPEEALVEVMKDAPRAPLTTLRGETVKSQQELLIANFLFIHRIPYEYERPYEHDLADPTHGQYQPDFYYPTIGTYHEHFAIDSKGEAPEDFAGYMEKVIWRREAHHRFGTKFFETKSADFEDKTVFDKLLYFLKEHGYDFRTMSVDAPSLGEVQIKDRVSETLDSFITNKKLTGISSQELHTKAELTSEWTRESLPLAEFVASSYDEYLKKRMEIDFTDMLLDAAKAYKETPTDIGIRYLLVDEFQDMSKARAELIHGILRNNPGCKLFGVGDDWQSINGFSGSEVRIMTEFDKVFGQSTTQRLTNTFRSNQGISSVASNFIMKNPAQLNKEIQAKDPESEGVIEVHLFDQPDEVKYIAASVMKKQLAAAPPGKKPSVFVLARYKAFLFPGTPSKFEKSHLALTKQMAESAAGGEIELKLTTFHGSKGLEADVVFLLGFVEKKLNPRCFPSRVQEEELVRLPLPKLEDFPDAEERRLMYVALTRARHKVIIPAPATGMSEFVSELLEYTNQVRLIYHGQTSIPCPFCHGGLLLPGTRSRYECTNLNCLFSGRKTKCQCPQCKSGSLVIKPGQHGHFVGCDSYPICKYIDKRYSQMLRGWDSFENDRVLTQQAQEEESNRARLHDERVRKAKLRDTGFARNDSRSGHVFSGGELSKVDCPVKLD